MYHRHFPTHVAYGDITAIDPVRLPAFDLLCGGFPCQAFSVAGKRRGFEDTRGTLFFDVCRIAREKRPRLLLLENVKGLLSHDGGKTFGTILGALDDLGYDADWQVCNSKHFGVPQNRERVFIVGHLRGIPGPEVFPLPGGGGPDVVEATAGVPQSVRVYSPGGVAPTLFGNDSGGGKTPKILAGVAASDPPVVVARNQRGEIRSMPYAGTITATRSAKQFQLVNGVRRLTPLECERLQGFPDGWTAGFSDTQRYKMLGNAVTVNVVRAIVSRLSV